MKNLLSIILLISAFQAFSQHISRYNYHNNDKSKLKEIYHVRDTLNNVLEGPYLSYYLNGNIESKGQFSNNETVGVWEFYYETGGLKMRGALRNNSNYGLWEYFYENGNKQMEGRIINRNREGPWKMYYESGELKTEGAFDNNKRSGVWKSYFEDGKLKGEIEYTEDTGPYIEYYHTGEIKAEGEKDGLNSTGYWKFYNKDGSLQAEGYYTHGNKSGNWMYYYPNGRLSSEGSYDSDQPTGEWKYYYESGELNVKGNFIEGEKEGTWNAYYPGGSVKSSINYVNGEGEFNEYYDNGNLKATGFLMKGVKQGHWKYYYSNGQLEGEAAFDQGRGKYTGYYMDGTIQTTGIVENEQRIGTWELFDKEGTLKGYYRPFYDNDTLQIEEIVNHKIMEQKPIRNYGVADFGFRKSKFKYFNSRVNEYQAIILSTNPFGALIGRVPVAAEIYLQERLGYEMIIEAVRDPFFTPDPKISENHIYTRGYMISIAQKFYNPDDRFGLFYFGHSLAYSNFDHNVKVLKNGNQMYQVSTAREAKYIYRIILGYRLMKSTYSKGLTVDGYLSLGSGYRDFDVKDEERKDFDTLSKREIPLDFSFGIHFGYSFPFKRKR